MLLNIIEELEKAFQRNDDEYLSTNYLRLSLFGELPQDVRAMSVKSFGKWLSAQLAPSGIKPEPDPFWSKHERKMVRGYRRPATATSVNVTEVFEATERLQPAVLQGVCSGCGAARLGRPGAWRPCWRCRAA
jgi:hypothetical protein